MRPKFQKKEEAHKINEKIRAREIRLVGDNVETEVVSLEKGLQIARELDLDLVEIVPNANPPVCKVIDYKKFLYEQKKKAKELKAKASKITIKEIRFGPNTDDHDFNFKVNHAIKFLEDNAKVKAFVFFKGRSIIYKEQGEMLLLRFAQALEEHGKVESIPALEGKRMIMFLAPKKKIK